MIDVIALRSERGKLCEWCHQREGTQRHHALFRRDIHKPELDDRKNLILVCAKCHMSGVVDSKEAKHIFWLMLCAQYGKKEMLQWLDSLPLKVRHFEFIAGDEDMLKVKGTITLDLSWRFLSVGSKSDSQWRPVTKIHANDIVRLKNTYEKEFEVNGTSTIIVLSEPVINDGIMKFEFCDFWV